MNTMGFSTEDQENILSVTAALLHCSNLEFIAISADECEIDRDSPSLEPILSLLGFTADALNRALCYFSIKAGKEIHTRSLSKASAAKGLLGFIKGNNDYSVRVRSITDV
jgi:myosin heavy subunit